MKNTGKLLERLLELYIKGIKDSEIYTRTGLCLVINYALAIKIITIVEANELRTFITNHKPKRSKGVYYYPQGDTLPRIKYLKYWIRKCNQ